MRAFQVPYVPEPIRKLKRHLFRRSDGERILTERFNRIHGGDLGNPRSFTEKLYHRMIDVNRDGNPTFTRLADKHLVREQIATIADIRQEDCQGVEAAMTKCSRWLPGHDQAAAARAPVPEPSELKGDIDALENWVAAIRKRR